MGSLLLAPSLLRAAGLPIGAALVHGWNPFIVKEVAGSGRLDAVAIFFLIAALRLAQTPRFRGAAAVAYGVSLNGPLLLAGSLPLMGRALRGFVAPALVIGVLGWTLTFPVPGTCAPGGRQKILWAEASRLRFRHWRDSS